MSNIISILWKHLLRYSLNNNIYIISLRYYKQEIKVNKAFADVIQCKCPEKMDENGNEREYIAFEINYLPQNELVYKKKYEQAMFGDMDKK